ncbi:MAG: phosphate ABC transporter permease PstA [Anaerolineae bacterium]|nr:phosphate ABC transporter permease PstA [Anaerolineae bacterium]
MSQKTSSLRQGYPEGDKLESFIKTRNRWGVIWRTIFMASTVVAIIALTALLYNIINGSFGYVVVQNKIDPAALVLGVEKERLLTAPNTFSSEDDNELAQGIENNPSAIGFFGYAYYQDNADKLRALSVEGVEPNAQTAESGEYLGSRPLYIYSAADVIRSKPQVAGFINYYLTHVNEVVANVGYFPVSGETLAQSRELWLQATANEKTAESPYLLPAVDPSNYDQEAGLAIAGSSTVYPLTREIAKNFRRAGFAGPISIESVGTGAGFTFFCVPDGIDIANASRPIKRAEFEACRKARREPLEFRVGTDALAIVVSQKNDFLQNVTADELRSIFTVANNWSDVNPAWPDTPIERYIPGADSGTLDFFAESVFVEGLPDLPKDTLVAILEANLSTGLMRRLETDKPFSERSRDEVYDLVVERVVEQRIVKSWKLSESIFHKDEIIAFAETVPQGELQFRSWLHWDFLVAPQSSTPELAGIRTAIFGSLWVIFITILIALPIGVGGAIYLEEYAAGVGNPLLRRVNAIIQTNINNLAGVPSIIYGMLGLAIFVRALEPLTSGAMLGLADPTTANGRTILSASLTLALLILPLIIINAQEAIRAVPQSLRQAGMGLGATKWQTIWHHVLPNAIPGILTGNILAVSRAIGETAPLVVIGASTFITVDPTGPFSKFTVLPIQIYQWTARPQDEFRNIAAAAIIILLILLLTLNASAVLLRNRYSRRLI